MCFFSQYGGVSVIRRVLDVSGGGEVVENDYSRIQLNRRLTESDALLKLSCI
jgi:hypothetical protein